MSAKEEKRGKRRKRKEAETRDDRERRNECGIYTMFGVELDFSISGPSCFGRRACRCFPLCDGRQVL